MLEQVNIKVRRNNQKHSSEPSRFKALTFADYEPLRTFTNLRRVIIKTKQLSELTDEELLDVLSQLSRIEAFHVGQPTPGSTTLEGFISIIRAFPDLQHLHISLKTDIKLTHAMNSFGYHVRQWNLKVLSLQPGVALGQSPLKIDRLLASSEFAGFLLMIMPNLETVLPVEEEEDEEEDQDQDQEDTQHAIRVLNEHIHITKNHLKNN
jgi:hypothetical protein